MATRADGDTRAVASGGWPGRALGFILLAALGMGGSGCAIAHLYPAQEGRVLDLETGAPLAGVGIMAEYYVSVGTIGGAVPLLVGVAEAETDADGRFRVGTKPIFRPVIPTPIAPASRFDKEPVLNVFLPGYESLTIRGGRIQQYPPPKSSAERAAEHQYLLLLAPCHTLAERQGSYSRALQPLYAKSARERRKCPHYTKQVDDESAYLRTQQ
jgi:hypothetical protein